jgi:hypothetical protein
VGAALFPLPDAGYHTSCLLFIDACEGMGEIACESDLLFTHASHVVCHPGSVWSNSEVLDGQLYAQVSWRRPSK